MRTTTPLWTDEASIEIAASPERIWQLVADVTRMGEWSPVCHACEWIAPSVGVDVGARFVGHNRQGAVRWSRVCEVTASEPGRELAFRTFFRGAESTRWRYRLEPTATATRVVESFEVVSIPLWVQVLHWIPGMHERARRDGVRNMTRTLERLRGAAEKE